MIDTDVFFGEIDNKVCESVERQIKSGFIPYHIGKKDTAKSKVVEYDFDKYLMMDEVVQPDYDDAKLIKEKG